MNLSTVLTKEIEALDLERATLQARIKTIDATKRTLNAALKIQPVTPETPVSPCDICSKEDGGECQGDCPAAE